MRALAGARNVWPALLMLGAVGCIHARGQKTFLLNLYRLNSVCKKTPLNDIFIP